MQNITKIKSSTVQHGDRIFTICHGFLSFAKNMGKNIGKSLSKNLSGKHSHKILDHVKQSATDELKTASKGTIERTDEAIGDLTVNKIADKFQKHREVHHKIIQKRLKVKQKKQNLIEKYQKKIYISRRKTENYS